MALKGFSDIQKHLPRLGENAQNHFGVVHLPQVILMQVGCQALEIRGAGEF